MGADASLFLFDYSVYRDKLAPAFIEYLKTGHAGDWLQSIRRMFIQYWEINDIHSPRLKEFEPVDLTAHCDYLDAQFGIAAPVAILDLYECTWETRACKSSTCLIRNRCPFLAHPQTNPITGDVEEFRRKIQFGPCWSDSGDADLLLGTGGRSVPRGSMVGCVLMRLLSFQIVSSLFICRNTNAASLRWIALSHHKTF